MDIPGKNTRVDCHFLLQGIFLTQGLNPCLLCVLHWWADYLLLCHLGGPPGIIPYPQYDIKCRNDILEMIFWNSTHLGEPTGRCNSPQIINTCKNVLCARKVWAEMQMLFPPSEKSLRIKANSQVIVTWCQVLWLLGEKSRTSFLIKRPVEIP